jgi:hypothetical protein
MGQEPGGPPPVVPELAESVPTVSVGPRILAREVHIYKILVDCPRCNRPLNVTDVDAGRTMTCPCGNVTWRPEIKQRWWFPAGRFVAVTIGSFLLGFGSSLAATWAWEHWPSARGLPAKQSQQPTQPSEKGPGDADQRR